MRRCLIAPEAGSVRSEVSAGHVRGWVNSLACYADFIVKMRASGAAGGADVANKLALGHTIACRHSIARKVRVTGFQFAAMIKRDELAVAAVGFSLGHVTVRGGVNRGAGWAGKVNAGVSAAGLQNRVVAHAV